MTAPASDLDAWLRAHLFDAVPVSICVIDRGFRIVRANRPFAEAYGPWARRPCFEVYKGRQAPCEACAAAETFRDGGVRSREEEGAPGEDGSRTQYLVHMVPIPGPGGAIEHVLEMSTDITPVKRLEREKREAERLAVVGETVAGIAHGIKNVLMGLEGGVYAVRSGIERQDDERIARGWDMVQENVRRVSQFVKEFLDFAKGRETRVAWTDPNAPVERVLRLFGDQAAAAGVRLVARLAEGLAPVPLDEDGLATAVANLVSNAIDACRCTEGPGPHTVTVTTQLEGTALVYEVADTGQGMDAQISRQVFSKFFTTKGADRGTGLGLLTTKRIVHQHGGRISFTTAEGRGSTFRIVLPREALPPVSPVPPDARAAPADGDARERLEHHA